MSHHGTGGHLESQIPVSVVHFSYQDGCRCHGESKQCSSSRLNSCLVCTFTGTGMSLESPAQQQLPSPSSKACRCPNTTSSVAMTTGADTGGQEATSAAGEEGYRPYSALGGGLGGLSAILAILLVGVIMGWMWSCCRRHEESKK